ncbi:DUF3192 domain-containing protein [Chromatiaceae bacterium AAb-1]|nr:DUF3192 domain-containing protein [Chromatiaceae bacterium AAb-1]
MLLKILTAAVLAISLSGCVIAIGDKQNGSNSDWKKEQRYNQEQINKLATGNTIDEIRNLLGVPDFSESFSKDGETVQVLFYRTHHTKSDGRTTKDECTPLIFRQGKLTGWGDKAYQYL